MDAEDRQEETEKLVQKHEYTLYGVNGDNGLNGTVKKHTEQIAGMEKRIYILCAAFAFVGGSAGDLLKGFLG
jgi:hypothetical protein